jgi:hypothetical protein
MHDVVPRRIDLHPTLVVPNIQLGRSLVRKTPENILPVSGDVTKGMNMRSTRFCSAMMLFSPLSSGRGWSSNALETTLTNLTSRLAARAGLGGSGGRPPVRAS